MSDATVNPFLDPLRSSDLLPDRQVFDAYLKVIVLRHVTASASQA